MVVLSWTWDEYAQIGGRSQFYKLFQSTFVNEQLNLSSDIYDVQANLSYHQFGDRRVSTGTKPWCQLTVYRLCNLLTARLVVSSFHECRPRSVSRIINGSQNVCLHLCRVINIIHFHVCGLCNVFAIQIKNLFVFLLQKSCDRWWCWLHLTCMHTIVCFKLIFDLIYPLHT